MTPSRLVGWLVIVAVTLLVLLLALVVTLTVLTFTGGPSLAPVCGGRILDLAPSPERSLDARWDGFDTFLEGGVPDALDVEEGVVTARARAFLEGERQIGEISELVICFFGPEDPGSLGYAEVRGRIELPLPASVAGTLRGRLDLGGAHPVLEVTRLEVGNLPEFLTLRVRQEIEDAVNAALAGVALRHRYSVEFGDGFARVIGRPR
jgi:hypothetical protein